MSIIQTKNLYNYHDLGRGQRDQNPVRQINNRRRRKPNQHPRWQTFQHLEQDIISEGGFRQLNNQRKVQTSQHLREQINQHTGRLRSELNVESIMTSFLCCSMHNICLMHVKSPKFHKVIYFTMAQRHTVSNFFHIWFLLLSYFTLYLEKATQMITISDIFINM